MDDRCKKEQDNEEDDSWEDFYELTSRQQKEILQKKEAETNEILELMKKELFRCWKHAKDMVSEIYNIRKTRYIGI